MASETIQIRYCDSSLDFWYVIAGRQNFQRTRSTNVYLEDRRCASNSPAPVTERDLSRFRAGVPSALSLSLSSPLEYEANPWIRIRQTQRKPCYRHVSNYLLHFRLIIRFIQWNFIRGNNRMRSCSPVFHEQIKKQLSARTKITISYVKRCLTEPATGPYPKPVESISNLSCIYVRFI